MSVYYRLHQDQSVGTKRTAKSFTVADHIEGMHVVFTPERTHDTAGNRVKQFLQGVKCEELPENKVEKEDSGD